MTGGKNEKNWQKLIAATVSQLNCNFNLWKRSFRARLSFQNWKLKLRKTKPELSVPTRGQSEHNPTEAERGRHPSRSRPVPSIFWGTFCAAKHSISRIVYLSKTHFMRDFPQTESWSCENEASVRNVLQNWKLSSSELILISSSSQIPHLNAVSSQLTLRSCHPQLNSPSSQLTLRWSHSHLLSPWDHLTLSSTHPHLKSLWDHVTCFFCHSEIILPLSSLTLRLSHLQLHSDGVGCVSGGCNSGGCGSGVCDSGGCDSGGCGCGGCDSGGCDSGGCDNGGGGCNSGGCDSGGRVDFWMFVKRKYRLLNLLWLDLISSISTVYYPDICNVWSIELSTTIILFEGEVLCLWILYVCSGVSTQRKAGGGPTRWNTFLEYFFQDLLDLTST